MFRGTIPVIRKWPILDQYASAENIYASDWIFQDATSMANFIRDSIQNGKLGQLQEKANKDAETNYGYEQVWSQYRSLFGS